MLDAGAALCADAPAKTEPQPDDAGARPPAPDGGAAAALAAVQREMAAAKEAAAAEIALMRRQLASAQAAASEAEKVRAAPPWSCLVCPRSHMAAPAARRVLEGTRAPDRCGAGGRQRAEAAAAEAAEEAGKVMRLEVALAESRQALARGAELEKEVERYRRAAPRARCNKPGEALRGRCGARCERWLSGSPGRACRRLAREAEESKGRGASVWGYISGAS